MVGFRNEVARLARFSQCFPSGQTYSDKICYHPECDVHECRVLLPKGVRIALRRMSSWGIRMELSRIAWRRMSSWGIQMELSRMGPYTLHTQTVPLATFGYLIRNYVRSDMSGSFDRIFHIWIP